MDEILEQGIVGIVTGILTTVILFIIRNVWSTRVVPFLAATRYQGVEIDGPWAGSSGNDDPEKGEIYKAESSLFLEQSAHHLSGTFLFKFKNNLKSFHLDFDVKGYMWEGYITLNFTPKDKRITSYATSLLKLHGGGQALVGSMLFRDVDNEFVNQVPMWLVRTEGS